MTLMATITATPIALMMAPHQFWSVSLYQKDKLKYTPMKISAIITIGITPRPSR